MKIIFALIFFLGLLTQASAKDVDCYAKGKIPDDKREYSLSIVLMLDETTVFDDPQRTHIIENVTRLAVPGTELKIVAFSAYIGNRYMRPLRDFLFAAPLDKKTANSMRRDFLREFEKCLKSDLHNKSIDIQSVVQSYFKSASSDIAKSDILGALKDVTDNVGPRLKGKRRMVVLVSDMLENSNITSFYINNGIRAIDAFREMANVESKGMLPDFRQAAVYVIGAGVMPSTLGKSALYLSSERKALSNFWAQYFQKSNAKLIEFGAPLLLTPISVTP